MNNDFTPPLHGRRIIVPAIIALFSLLIRVIDAAPDPMSYTVPVKNFSHRIYQERVSRFILTSGSDAFSLIETHYQRIESRQRLNDKTRIRLLTGEGITGAAEDKESLSRHLADSRFLNLDSPEIKKAAASIRADDAAATIPAVEEFVYRHITDKTMGIPLIPARDILKGRCGDCTEHSVLTVALLRSRGMPSRAVAGMVLARDFQGKNNVFVYHMWVEAFCKGRWVLVDSTLPGEKHLNRYIAFAYHSLQTEMPLAYLRAISSIENLTAEYLLP